MTSERYPVLALVYPLSTDPNLFQSFRNDASAYLVQHGFEPASAIYQIAMSVGRGGQQSRSSFEQMVELIATETGSGDGGPRGQLQGPLPILRGFYEKYVQGANVEWGKYVGVQEAIVDELCAAHLVW